MNNKATAWVIDDDRSIRWVLEKALVRAGFTVVCFENANRPLHALRDGSPDVIVTDVRMPGIDGLQLLDRLQHDFPDLPVIVMTAHADLDSAVAAYSGGAFEYLPKPFDVEDAVSVIRRAVDQKMNRSADASAAEFKYPSEIIGEAPAMQDVFRAIGRLSRSNVTVLINGETGTGKELVASALHRHSPRSDGPFIALNTAAIPKELLESELFGHERGAFTGAQGLRHGRFEQADGGTLFLDEIGDMPAELQTRLLRVLADGEFYRVGGHVPIKVDVRVIAATHQDLEHRVAEGLFREDLFHRLNVIRIHIPALRDRREDIPLLLSHFLSLSGRELNMEPKRLSKEAESFLCHLDWPGNVRQLVNTCHWLTVMAAGQQIQLADLPRELRESRPADGIPLDSDWQAMLENWADQQLARGCSGLLDEATPRFERAMITSALHHTGGRRQAAAKLLGWGRNTLTRKIKELGLEFDEPTENS
jgi:two-component system nitrogen regulation response regulator GlnG